MDANKFKEALDAIASAAKKFNKDQKYLPWRSASEPLTIRVIEYLKTFPTTDAVRAAMKDVMGAYPDTEVLRAFNVALVWSTGWYIITARLNCVQHGVSEEDAKRAQDVLLTGWVV